MQVVSSLADLENLLDLARKKRVMSISIEGISVAFHPRAFEEEQPAAGPKQPEKKPHTGKKGIVEEINGEPIDEDVLFHSAGDP